MFTLIYDPQPPRGLFMGRVSDQSGTRTLNLPPAPSKRGGVEPDHVPFIAWLRIFKSIGAMLGRHP
jgi:hypothetical protein